MNLARIPPDYPCSECDQKAVYEVENHVWSSYEGFYLCRGCAVELMKILQAEVG